MHVWPPAGVYTNFVGLTFDSTDGHTRFTLDGTEALPSSQAFDAPILIATNAIVRARRFKQGKPVSEELTAAYTVVEQDVFSFKSGLPLVIVNTLGGEFPFWERIPAFVTVIGSTNGFSSLSGPVHYSGRAEIGLRGSSSRHRPKRPYRIELQDESGNDLKAPLLGMAPEADWILLPGYMDATLIRDALAYELWRRMGHYAVQARYVELFLVRENRAHEPLAMRDYQGIYLLTEKIKRGKDRLGLKNLKADHDVEPEITGGYIFKKDRLNPGEKGFTTTHGVKFALEEPKESEILAVQLQWLTNHIKAMEEKLFGPEFGDPVTGYQSFLDVKSFVDFHWIVEASLNPDGYGYSVFLHKDRGGKIRMGPVWDWDLGFGNGAYTGNARADEWQWERFSQYPLYQWYARLFEDPDFLQAYMDRWSELRGTVFTTANVLGLVDALTGSLREALDRNYQRWPTLAPFMYANRRVGATYQEHVNWLKRWIENRLLWIDSQGFPPPKATLARDEAGSLLIRLDAEGGDIYFSRGAADPRVPGGKISADAQKYLTPLPMKRGERLFSRTLSPFGLWSPPLLLEADELARRAESFHSDSVE